MPVIGVNNTFNVEGVSSKNMNSTNISKKESSMKHPFFAISILMLISALSLPSCKEDYTPIQANATACAIEIECLGASDENLLTDKSFIDKIKVEGDNSHSNVKFTVSNNRLCFDADLPDQNDMKWAKDRGEASGLSKMTVKFGKQKASLKCFLKYTPNRPPAPAGGTLICEQVEYLNQTYNRSGNAVRFAIRFNKNGKIE